MIHCLILKQNTINTGRFLIVVVLR